MYGFGMFVPYVCRLAQMVANLLLYVYLGSTVLLVASAAPLALQVMHARSRMLLSATHVLLVLILRVEQLIAQYVLQVLLAVISL